MADQNLDRFRERRRGLGKPNLIPGVSDLGKFRIYNTAGQVTSTQPVKLTGSLPSGVVEKCWDQNHRAGSLKQTNRGSRVFRTGGPFTKLKIEIPAMEIKGTGKYSTKGNPGFSGLAKWEYEGGFTCPDISFDGISLLDYKTGGSSVLKDNSLVPTITSAMENEAWNIRPKLERGSLSNALYELKDMPGMLKHASQEYHHIWRQLEGRGSRQKFGMAPKRAADAFLAAEFGWIPFVSDVTKMLDNIIFSEQYLADLSSQNNTWVKRRRVSTETASTKLLKRLYTQSVLPNGFTVVDLCKDFVVDGITCRGTCNIYADEILRVWYEGSFKFYRPELDRTLANYDSFASTMRRHILLHGLRINPTHIWKAIPWSWAVDWLSNVGDLITRADEQYNDGMVAKYLYIMHHRSLQIRSQHYLNFWSGALTLDFTRSVETKLRQNASSPYGFVLGGDLSATQWSIIAALGLSRNVRFTKS